MLPLDPGTGQPVEDAELLLAQALVDDQFRRALGEAADGAEQLRRLLAPGDKARSARRWALIRWHRAEPPAERQRLLLAEAAKGHIGIPDRDVDLWQAGGIGRVACDIAGALPMSDDP